MQLSPRRAQLTPLLSNKVLDGLERLRIASRRRFTNKSRGEHLSGKGGRSTEFSDYRDYAPGDDTRFVDWNAFARLNRPYMKVYRQEEEMHVVILVDASASMGFEGKLHLAKSLGAAFGIMGLLGDERVSAYAFNGSEGPVARLSPCVGRASLPRLLRFFEAVEAGGDAPVELAVETFLRRHTGRGVAVVLSDFLTFGDLGRALNLLWSSGLEAFGLQILSPSEIEPELDGDLRLVDCESQATLDVGAGGGLLEFYREHRLAYEGRVAGLCRQRGGRFASISSAGGVERVLFDLLRRRGWVQ